MPKVTRSLVGSVLMLVAIQMGLGPPFVDIDATHVLNPDWVPHARLHVVWFLSVGFMLGLVMIYLIWGFRDRRSGHRLAFILISTLPVGFYIASATDSLYGGVLVDPKTASQLPFNDVILGVSANMFTLTVGWVVAMIGFGLSRTKVVDAESH